MRHKLFSLYNFILCTVLLSGCWSQKELTELAIITALGIDKNDKGEYVGSFQIIVPGNVTGMQGAGSGGGAPFDVATATGKNLVDVSDNLSKKISRRQYFSHTGLVIISEELAKEDGIMPILDTLDRDTDFRTTASVMIAENTTAQKIISTLAPLDKISSENVLKTMKFSGDRLGENIDVTVNELIKGLISSTRVPVITGMRLIGNEEKIGKMESLQDTVSDVVIETGGLAVIKEGKLIEWLHGETSKGAVWVLDRIKDTSIFINWEDKKEAISFKVIRQKTDVSAYMNNKTPSISIHVRAEGNIAGTTVPVNISDPHELHKIEKKLAEEIKGHVENSVQHMQKEKADIFGFGEAINRSYPDAWKELKIGWNENHFPELKVNVKVDTYVRRSGLRNKSFLTEIENNQ